MAPPREERARRKLTRPSRERGDACLALVEVAMKLSPWTMLVWVLGTFAFYDREKVKRELGVWPVEAKRMARAAQRPVVVTVLDV